MKTKHIILLLIAGALVITVVMNMLGGGDDAYNEISGVPAVDEVFDDSEVFTDEIPGSVEL